VTGLSDDAVHDRFTLGAATLGLLSAAAEQAPRLIVVDDAQWLDPVSGDALSFAFRRLAVGDLA
jgi:predicted ATPase